MATDSAPRRGIDTATAVVEGAADGLADGIDEHRLDQTAPALARDAAPIAQRGLRSERLRAKLEKADEKVSAAIDATRGKARAVAESARRARKAPAQVWADAKDGAKAYASGLVASILSYTIAGLVGAIALILLTVGAVQGLNDAWGSPRGTFAVAGLYLVLAFVFVAMAKGKAEAGKRTAKLRMTQARLEVQRVAEPLREAFRRKPAAASTFGQVDDKTRLAAGSGPDAPLPGTDEAIRSARGIAPPATASTTTLPRQSPSTETFPGREP